MLPALSQVCSLHSPFERDVADYAAGKCGAIEVWLTKLEEFLKSHSLDNVRRLLDEHEMAAPVASFQGGLLVSQGERRRAHWEHFQRRLQLCQELGVGVLVVACDIAGPLTQETLDRASVSLSQIAALAADHEVRIALEFQKQAAFGNNVPSTAAMIAEVGSTHLGLCLDAFHFDGGPSKLADLALLRRDNLFHVQLCDVAGAPRELAADGDRILPGDGDFDLRSIIEHLRRIGYQRCVSIELMNPQIWRVPPLQFGEIGMTALRHVLEQSGMGDKAAAAGRAQST